MNENYYLNKITSLAGADILISGIVQDFCNIHGQLAVVLKLTSPSSAGMTVNVAWPHTFVWADAAKGKEFFFVIPRKYELLPGNIIPSKHVSLSTSLRAKKYYLQIYSLPYYKPPPSIRVDSPEAEQQSNTPLSQTYKPPRMQRLQEILQSLAGLTVLVVFIGLCVWGASHNNASSAATSDTSGSDQTVSQDQTSSSSSTDTSSLDSSSGTYTNSYGVQVEMPDNNSNGATAQCNDGLYSHSQHDSGTCSGNGGVAQWLN